MSTKGKKKVEQVVDVKEEKSETSQEVNIPFDEKIKEILSNLSKVVDVDIKDIIKEFSGIYVDEFKQNSNGYNQDILVKRSLNKLKNFYKRQKMTAVVTVRGVFFGKSKIRDMNSKLRELCLKKFEETGDFKYVLTTSKVVSIDKKTGKKEVEVYPTLDENQNVIPVDYRFEIEKKDKTKFKNMNYGKPISINNVKNYYGFFCSVDDKGAEGQIGYSIMTLRGDNATKVELPIGKMVELKVILDRETKTYNAMSDPQTFTPPKVLDDSSINLDKLFESMSFKTPIKNIKDVWKERQKLYGEYNADVIVEANVLTIDPVNAKTGNQIITVDDESMSLTNESIKIIIPDYLHDFVDFDVDSVVDFSLQMFTTEESKDMYMANGIYAIPELKKEISLESLDFADDIEVSEEVKEGIQRVLSTDDKKEESVELKLEDLK